MSESEAFCANSIGPAPCFAATKSRKSGKKSPKCTETDQFRLSDFLTTAYFHSSYTPFDAELHAEFFELICMFVRRFVLELLTKTWSKNSRRNFADSMASEKGHSQSSQINIFLFNLNKIYSVRRIIACKIV